MEHARETLSATSSLSGLSGITRSAAAWRRVGSRGVAPWALALAQAVSEAVTEAFTPRYSPSHRLRPARVPMPVPVHPYPYPTRNQ